MKFKRTGSTTVMMTVFIMSGVLSSVLGVRQAYRLSTTPSWVASDQLMVGQPLTAQVLKQARVSDNEAGISDIRALVGKQLRVAKAEGEVIYSKDLATPARSWLSQQIPEGRVLYTLMPRSGSIPYSQLRNGDRLDVLVKGARGVKVVASDILLIGALKSKAKTSDDQGRAGMMNLAMTSRQQSGQRDGNAPLVIAVHPEDIYPLASIGDKDEVSLVLHSEGTARDGKLLKIEPDPTHRQVEVVNGLTRKNILVQ